MNRLFFIAIALLMGFQQSYANEEYCRKHGNEFGHHVRNLSEIEKCCQKIHSAEINSTLQMEDTQYTSAGKWNLLCIQKNAQTKIISGNNTQLSDIQTVHLIPPVKPHTQTPLALVLNQKKDSSQLLGYFLDFHGNVIPDLIIDNLPPSIDFSVNLTTGDLFVLDQSGGIHLLHISFDSRSKASTRIPLIKEFYKPKSKTYPISLIWIEPLSSVITLNETNALFIFHVDRQKNNHQEPTKTINLRTIHSSFQEPQSMALITEQNNPVNNQEIKLSVKDSEDQEIIIHINSLLK